VVGFDEDLVERKPEWGRSPRKEARDQSASCPTPTDEYGPAKGD